MGDFNIPDTHRTPAEMGTRWNASLPRSRPYRLGGESRLAFYYFFLTHLSRQASKHIHERTNSG
jgi:hypothetical protein